MEKFKAVEKEMKTKAFSKEGLSAAAKMDPKEKEKAEICSFLSDMVEDLERQVETLEAEEEALLATTKKGKKDQAKNERLSEITRLNERHKWHQNRLELLLRAVENGNVEVDQVNDVKDGIKYYVEENQNVDFLEDDTIYDDFNLDADEAAWGVGGDADHLSSQDAQSVQDENNEPPETNKLSKQKSVSEGPSLIARRPSNSFKSPLPGLSTLHTPLNNVTNTIAASSMKPALPPARPPGETLKYASAAAAAAASDKAIIAPLPPPPPPAAVSTSQPIALAPLSITQSKSSEASPATSSSIPAKSTKPPSLAAASPTVSYAASGSIPPTPALETSEPVSVKGKAAVPLETAPEESEEISPEPSEPDTPPPPHAAAAAAATNGLSREEDDGVESIFHLPECLHDLVSGYSATKDLSKDPTAPEAQRLLNISYESGADVVDFEKPRFYRPRNKYSVPRHYPTEPSSTFDDQNMYERIDNDTLFFLFYYRQNTYSQHQAAKALKGQSWRFHKQYQTWFQRHEEPKTITEEYEQCTYRFFDYESTW